MLRGVAHTLIMSSECDYSTNECVHFANSSLLNKVLEFPNFLTCLIFVSYKPVSYKKCVF